MNLEELRDVQTRERATDSLQELPDSFYADVGEYIEDLRAEREAAAAAADDPFSDPEVSRLTDEIESAEQVAEAIYERRVGKIVKQASFAAADMPGDEGGLTAEERELFDDLVDRISANKSRVLDVLAGDGPDGGGGDADSGGAPGPDAARGGRDTRAERGDADAERSDPAPVGDVASADEGPDADPVVDAADLMGDGSGTATADPASGDRSAAGGTGRGDAESPATSREAESASPTGGPREGDADRESQSQSQSQSLSQSQSQSGTDTERTTVRVTRDVGEVLGVDETVYTLESEDVVDLPAANAEPLLERDAAERLD